LASISSGNLTTERGEAENPVAIVQLANDNLILLFQVSAMTEFPASLRILLESSLFLKVGVGIQHDCQKLYRDFRVSCRNCVELAFLARSVDNAQWKGKYSSPIGLARLLETYENYTLAKGKVQRSNWERHLTDNQQDYAANDAYVGSRLYSRLIQMAHEMPTLPLPEYYSFSFVNGMLLSVDGLTSWAPKNPFYDPGPPPPPKPPKDPNAPKNAKKKEPKVNSAMIHTPDSLQVSSSEMPSISSLLPTSSHHAFRGRRWPTNTQNRPWSRADPVDALPFDNVLGSRGRGSGFHGRGRGRGGRPPRGDGNRNPT